MFTPRDYQSEISERGYKILNNQGILILSCQVRTGKTFMSLMTCEKAKAKHVLFVTKKKAIGSIQDDYNTFNPAYTIEIINYESIHKVKRKDFDVIICDESHTLGAYPKPSKRTKKLKELVKNKRLILMSGTITPESYSQIYHQLWISGNTPFRESNFYKWSKVFVNVKKVFRAYGKEANDYSDANYKMMLPYLSKIMISYTQKQAGFTSQIQEKILNVKMKPITYQIAKLLRKDKVIVGSNGGVILGDTPVKELSKITQIYSGTVKLEDGSNFIFDTSKADYIKEYFKGQKIGIFYVYKAELEILKNVFGENLTQDLDIFNSTDKNIALQVVSGREGISLKNANSLVMYNIQHSAVSYWQSRDRMTTKERQVNNVYWMFAKNGIEQSIYNTVKDKESYTTKHYDRVAISV